MTPTTDLSALPAPYRVDGTWQSPGYRSARTRARWAMALLAIVTIAAGVLAAVTLSGYGLMSKYLAGDVVTRTDAEQLSANARTVAGLYFLALVASAIAFLAWLSRTVDNVPPLGGGTPRYSPRWSIGWWFVPIAFLWKPYAVARELAERLSIGGKAPTRLVVGWWLLFVGGFVLNEISSFMVRSDNPTAEQIRQSLMVNSAGLVSLTISGVLAVLMVRGIQRLANARALSLQLDAPAGVWPTAASMAAAQATLPPGAAAFGQPDPVGPAGPASADPSEHAGMASAATAYAAFCPACGRARTDEGRFCARCGTDLAVG